MDMDKKGQQCMIHPVFNDRGRVCVCVCVCVCVYRQKTPSMLCPNPSKPILKGTKKKDQSAHYE